MNKQNQVMAVGDSVRKVGGGYQADGWIVAAFTTRSGLARYVFEFAELPGMLHIFNDGQLEHRVQAPEGK